MAGVPAMGPRRGWLRHKSFRFLIVGHGAEEAWLRSGCRGRRLRACSRRACTGLREHDCLCFRRIPTRLECGAGGAGQRRAGDVTPMAGRGRLCADGVTGYCRRRDFSAAVAGVLGILSNTRRCGSRRGVALTIELGLGV